MLVSTAFRRGRKGVFGDEGGGRAKKGVFGDEGGGEENTGCDSRGEGGGEGGIEGGGGERGGGEGGSSESDGEGGGDGAALVSTMIPPTPVPILRVESLLLWNAAGWWSGDSEGGPEGQQATAASRYDVLCPTLCSVS